MLLYLDTSALVKRYVQESHSQEVVELIDRADAVGVSVLAQVEMAATLAKAARQNWIERKEAETAWQEAMEAPVVLATFDRELWLAASKSGVTVWPEGLKP